MFQLQTLVFPGTEIVAGESLYFRNIAGKAHASLRKKNIEIPAGVIISFDTYFNSLSVGQWKSKCEVNDLNLKIQGKGKVRLRFGNHILDHAHRWLDEMDIELSDTPLNIPLPFWNELDNGMLYFSVMAIENAEITAAEFYTNDLPLNDVKLGIVVTHFNRKEYVLPAMRRISDTILSDEYYQGKVQLVVVDNSQNIASHEAGKATVIPNENLGGAGGFTRGLLHLKDNNFTHCLFMDDDASCEMESICRAYAILSYAKDNEKTAIAGGLLLEDKPNVLHEKGGHYSNGRWQPLKSGLDMSHTRDLLLAEKNDDLTNYGAWWFFAFPISAVKHYAFPFFVRGDDILFSLQNEFDVITMNGISCWGEDFGIKESPMARYLSFRAALVINILMHSVTTKNVIGIFTKLYFSSLFSYNYASARAIYESLIDVYKGPAYFSENIDAKDAREKIASFSASEKLQPYEKTRIVRNDSLHESRLRSLLRKITVNGLLVPSFLMKDDIIYQGKNHRGILRQIFLYKKVLYRYDLKDIGYIAHHDKKKLLSGFKDYLSGVRLIAKKSPEVFKMYTHEDARLTTEKFWRDVYKQ